MKLSDCRLQQTIRDTTGGLWTVVAIDPSGECGAGYSVTLEHCHDPIRITARRDETLANFVPLMEVQE